MSKMWLLMIVGSIIMLLLSTPANVVLTMIGASKNAITMCIEFLGIYALWLGLLQILDDTKLSHKLSQLLSKPVDKIFGKYDDDTKKNICLNVASNILGLGSAATPFGLKAMQGMDKGSEKATKGMMLLVVINSTGIQVLPTTVIGLRALAGSVSPSSILFPTIIATYLPTILGILLIKLIYRKLK